MNKAHFQMVGFASGLSGFFEKVKLNWIFGTGWRKFIPAVHFQPCMDYLFTWCKLSRGEIDMVTNLSGPYQKIQCCVKYGHKGNFWNEVRWTTTTTTLWTIRACMKCSSMAGHCFQRWRISDSNAVRIYWQVFHGSVVSKSHVSPIRRRVCPSNHPDCTGR